MKHGVLFLMVFTILFLPFVAFAQETLTISTYYPSPYGSYGELETNILKLNPQASATCDAEGKMYYDTDGKLYICKGSPLSWLEVGKTLTTRAVTCNATFEGVANSYGCTATCNADENVLGGGFGWGAVFSDKGRVSMPSGNGWYCSINIASCSSNPPSCDSRCYAVCGK